MQVALHVITVSQLLTSFSIDIVQTVDVSRTPHPAMPPPQKKKERKKKKQKKNTATKIREGKKN